MTVPSLRTLPLSGRCATEQTLTEPLPCVPCVQAVFLRIQRGAAVDSSLQGLAGPRRDELLKWRLIVHGEEGTFSRSQQAARHHCKVTLVTKYSMGMGFPSNKLLEMWFLTSRPVRLSPCGQVTA